MFLQMPRVLALSFLLLAVVGTGESKVHLKKNGFRGLVVAINPDVEENPALIDAIKTAWTEASDDLFRATGSRAYFKEITIAVPTTWTKGDYHSCDPENDNDVDDGDDDSDNNGDGKRYRNTVNPRDGEGSAGNDCDDKYDDDSYNKAAVVIAYENPVHGDVPYTLQYGLCGQQGSYIHLTPDYLLDDKFIQNYGPRGKTIVHEWAHYRWGVFDEIATEGYDPFYLSSSGKIEANRCPTSIQGDNYVVDWAEGNYRSCNLDPQTMLPEDGCVFVPDETGSSAASTSIMSYQYLDSVNTFCHDDAEDGANLHNRAAPNEHNRLCNLRSTWDVITSSDDFQGKDPNLPDYDLKSTVPRFIVTQPNSYERFVLVLDTSGSMDGERLLMMRQAASTFLLQAVPTGSHVGMVEFSSDASTLSKMVEIEDYNDRLQLNSLLPSEAEGGTSIGSGILEAIELLEEDHKKVKGDILIVLSDGQENQSPTLYDVYQDTIDSGVIVYSIVFTADADPMLQVIAEDTGGIWYFADENSAHSTSALTDAFVTVAKVDDGNRHRETFQIYSNSFTVDPPAQHTGHIVVDHTIGNNTVFTFTWSQYVIPLGIVLSAPSGCNYATTLGSVPECDPGYDPAVDVDLKTVRFVISGTAETGTWIYYVNTQSTYSQKVVVTVTSMASDQNVQPIVVESGMSGVEAAEGQAVVVFAQVTQGYSPVLRADVTARIERPSGEAVTIVLKDEGAAPDIRKNDGVYSRYFTQYVGPGRYSVQVSVSGIEGKTKSSQSNPNSKAAFRVGNTNGGGLTLNSNGIPDTAELISTGNFSRFTSPGGFSYNGTSPLDVFPPSKISDLVAYQQDVTKTAGGIRMRFTAPGDEYDYGNATSYEIRYSYDDPLTLVSHFTSTTLILPADFTAGCTSAPQEAGSEEAFAFGLPDLPSGVSEVMVSVAVRAVDEVGNMGEVSNVQTLTYFIDPLVYKEPEVSTETDVEFILMIVFICLTSVLLLVVGGLVWKIKAMKKLKNAINPGYEHRNPYADDDC